MKLLEVFEEAQEIDRLGIQNRLLREHEMPVYDAAMSRRKNIRLLDIGCNDGSKIVDRFSGYDISRVIGVDYYDGLAQQAQEKYGDGVFSFHCCDVEGEDFPENLRSIMEQNSIEKFDIINLSFVLMHLDNPGRLIATLRTLLAEDGELIIIEADDSKSGVSDDSEKLTESFFNILRQDPLSGNRSCGEQLPKLLKSAGYSCTKRVPIRIEADGTQPQKRAELFDIFFSYLPEDIKLLHEQCPDDEFFKKASGWLADNYDRLESLALSGNHSVSIGITMFVSAAGEICKDTIPLPGNPGYHLERLSLSTVDMALDLCGVCVGKGLYSRQYITDIIGNPNHWFYLLKNENRELVGYTYYYLTDLDDMAAFSKTDKSVLSAMSSKSDPVIGNLRSLGIAPPFRRHRLAIELMQFSIDHLRRLHADVAFGAFWKANGKLPMKDSLELYEFKRLTDASMIWYDHEDLYCPVCAGRCRCDAVLHYKVLGEPAE